MTNEKDIQYAPAETVNKLLRLAIIWRRAARLGQKNFQEQVDEAIAGLIEKECNISGRSNSLFIEIIFNESKFVKDPRDIDMKQVLRSLKQHGFTVDANMTNDSMVNKDPLYEPSRWIKHD